MKEHDLSPTHGGLFNELCLRARLNDGSFGLLGRRIFAVICLTWAPLLVLTIWHGTAVGGVRIPLCFDLATQARFLLAAPLLLFAEVIAHRSVTPVVHQFLETGIIGEDDRPKFFSILETAGALRRSKLIECALIIFVLTVGQQLLPHRWMALKSSSWALTAAGAQTVTAAGWWMLHVSIPIFQYLLLRWYFRVLLWSVSLWRISRLNLNLVATHSDGCGGLGFLSAGLLTFGPFLLAHGFLAAGVIANRIFYDGATLISFKGTLAVLVGLMLIMTFAPLCSFWDKLLKTKIEGRIKYGAFATRYMSDFDQKWLTHRPFETSALIGSADIQSLADMTNSFAVVLKMRLFPFEKEKLITAVILILAPVSPLLLTMIPASELIKKVLGIFLG